MGQECRMEGWVQLSSNPAPGHCQQVLGEDWEHRGANPVFRSGFEFVYLSSLERISPSVPCPQPFCFHLFKSSGSPSGPWSSLPPLTEHWNKEEKSLFFQSQLWVKKTSACRDPFKFLAQIFEAIVFEFVWNGEGEQWGTREACELIVSKLSVQWKTPKISSGFFFPCCFYVLHGFVLVLLSTCSISVSLAFSVFFCVPLNSALASAVPLPAGAGKGDLGDAKALSFG